MLNIPAGGPPKRCISEGVKDDRLEALEEASCSLSLSSLLLITAAAGGTASDDTVASFTRALLRPDTAGIEVPEIQIDKINGTVQKGIPHSFKNRKGLKYCLSKVTLDRNYFLEHGKVVLNFY